MPGLDLKICSATSDGSYDFKLSHGPSTPRFQSHLEYPVLMALGSLVLLTLLLGCLAVEAELLHSHPHGGYLWNSCELHNLTSSDDVGGRHLSLYLASNSASHWTYSPNPTCQEADRKPVLQPQKSRQHVRPISWSRSAAGEVLHGIVLSGCWALLLRHCLNHSSSERDDADLLHLLKSPQVIWKSWTLTFLFSDGKVWLWGKLDDFCMAAIGPFVWHVLWILVWVARSLPWMCFSSSFRLP